MSVIEQVPQYTLTCQDDGRDEKYQLTVNLPGVESASEVEWEFYRTLVTVRVPGRYKLELPLNPPVCKTETLRFLRKTSQLKAILLVDVKKQQEPAAAPAPSAASVPAPEPATQCAQQEASSQTSSPKPTAAAAAAGIFGTRSGGGHEAPHPDNPNLGATSVAGSGEAAGLGDFRAAAVDPGACTVLPSSGSASRSFPDASMDTRAVAVPGPYSTPTGGVGTRHGISSSTQVPSVMANGGMDTTSSIASSSSSSSVTAPSTSTNNGNNTSTKPAPFPRQVHESFYADVLSLGSKASRAKAAAVAQRQTKQGRQQQQHRQQQQTPIPSATAASGVENPRSNSSAAAGADIRGPTKAVTAAATSTAVAVAAAPQPSQSSKPAGKMQKPLSVAGSEPAVARASSSINNNGNGNCSGRSISGAPEELYYVAKQVANREAAKQWLERALAAARQGDASRARVLLDRAVGLCPQDEEQLTEEYNARCDPDQKLHHIRRPQEQSQQALPTQPGTAAAAAATPPPNSTTSTSATGRSPASSAPASQPQPAPSPGTARKPGAETEPSRPNGVAAGAGVTGQWQGGSGGSHRSTPQRQAQPDPPGEASDAAGQGQSIRPEPSASAGGSASDNASASAGAGAGSTGRGSAGHANVGAGKSNGNDGRTAGAGAGAGAGGVGRSGTTGPSAAGGGAAAGMASGKSPAGMSAGQKSSSAGLSASGDTKSEPVHHQQQQQRRSAKSSGSHPHTQQGQGQQGSSGQSGGAGLGSGLGTGTTPRGPTQGPQPQQQQQQQHHYHHHGPGGFKPEPRARPPPSHSRHRNPGGATAVAAEDAGSGDDLFGNVSVERWDWWFTGACGITRRLLEPCMAPGRPSWMVWMALRLFDLVFWTLRVPRDVIGMFAGLLVFLYASMGYGEDAVGLDRHCHKYCRWMLGCAVFTGGPITFALYLSSGLLWRLLRRCTLAVYRFIFAAPVWLGVLQTVVLFLVLDERKLGARAVVASLPLLWSLGGTTAWRLLGVGVYLSAHYMAPGRIRATFLSSALILSWQSLVWYKALPAMLVEIILWLMLSVAASESRGGGSGGRGRARAGPGAGTAFGGGGGRGTGPGPRFRPGANSSGSAAGAGAESGDEQGSGWSRGGRFDEHHDLPGGGRLQPEAVKGATGEIARVLTACNYFAVLGLPSEGPEVDGLTDEAVKTAFRRCQLRVHPDKAGPDAAGAAEASQRVNQAYTLLQTTEGRRRLLQQMRAPAAASRRGGGGGGGASAPNSAQPFGYGSGDFASIELQCWGCKESHLAKLFSTDRSRARYCKDCRTHHSAHDNDIWIWEDPDAFFFPERKLLMCLNGVILDITEMGKCCNMFYDVYGKRLPGNTHLVPFKLGSASSSASASSGSHKAASSGPGQFRGRGDKGSGKRRGKRKQ